MGQREIIEIMERKWLTAQEIKDKLGIQSNSIDQALQRLVKHKEIDVKTQEDGRRKYFYKKKTN